ncbi:glycine betaine ABC transporter substrate-binding protein [Rhizobium sp. BK060]|uniref:glycine betaine ABC transporter substrate-binding protein OsmF n=1 Tax=Rhizobium sp. BK060 TaxID=2587096 RepID=UPI00160CC67D|nr:glycine betaine ABC transporter substrate-binding protein [Rhizobium sp. BK060]MBB3398790.1 osmoprotectant transport system substrate-binding protein [Rhizobium sp. BK060]
MLGIALALASQQKWDNDDHQKLYRGTYIDDRRGRYGRVAVVVSSKIDTEGEVLGNIILDMVEAARIPIVNQVGQGAGPVLRKALLSGQVDIYPEYTGNAAYFFNTAGKHGWRDAAQAYEQARKMDLDANWIVWLQRARANNTWGIAIREDLAQQHGIKSLSDFGRYVAGGGTIVLAGSSEFVTSPAALPMFEKVYGFKLKPDSLIVLAGGDTAATISAAANQTNNANAAMVYATDGGISAGGLVLLEDDKSAQPVYQPAPIIRQETLQKHPEIEKILKPVFEKLDLDTLRNLNAKVQVDGEPANSVATQFLTKSGFLK